VHFVKYGNFCLEFQKQDLTVEISILYFSALDAVSEVAVGQSYLKSPFTTVPKNTTTIINFDTKFLPQLHASAPVGREAMRLVSKSRKRQNLRFSSYVSQNYYNFQTSCIYCLRENIIDSDCWNC